MEKKNLSASQINTYLRCPMQYYFRYVRNLVKPPKSAQTLGSSVHAGIAHNYRQKKETRKDLKINEVLEAYSQSFEMAKDETEWEKDEKPGEIKDQGAGLIKVYHQIVAPRIQPKEVEQRFELNFENVDYGFLGYVDVIDKKKKIIDHKTTARTPSEIPSDHQLQLTGYALAYRAGTGKREKGIRLDYLVKTRQPKIVTLERQFDDRDIQRFLKIMAYVAKAIKNQLFYPQPHNFMCTNRGCGYWEECHKEF